MIVIDPIPILDLPKWNVPLWAIPIPNLDVFRFGERQKFNVKKSIILESKQKCAKGL